MSEILNMITSTSKTLNTADQKFLLPGHTLLECDVDHAKIERSKKYADVSIMVPRDWFQFVRTVRGKKPFQVHEMNQNDFFNFSKFLTTVLVKRTIDTDGNKVNWFNIKWICYEKIFSLIQFKCSLNDSEPFKTLDLRRQKKGRPQNYSPIYSSLQLCYSQPLPINPKKKADLLSMLPLIHENCHQFYKDLKTSNEVP